MNQKASPWCTLKLLRSEPGNYPLWCADRPARPVFCDNFWWRFDWEQPKPGEQMRIVFSRDQVEGAQESFFSRGFNEWRLGVPGRLFNFYTEIDLLLNELVPNEDDRIAGVTLWWWPEYR